jgi:hypothetical protein
LSCHSLKVPLPVPIKVPEAINFTVSQWNRHSIGTSNINYILKFHEFHKFKSMSGDKTKYSGVALKYCFLSRSFVKMQTAQQTGGKYKEDWANGTFCY